MLAKENPMIEKAVGILEILSGDEKVRMEAFYREREIRDELSRMQSARQEGREEGREQGEQEGRLKEKMETAKNFLKMGLSIEQISKGTGLNIEEIQKLKIN